ncbi:unnamed protein product [Paramecium octaurelia]|uniref:protein-tyrosine-phosphatase n=1 Tax=Paramecium octaurelia TaxID=43137 RepID=A0A8S1TZT4_PAROT|nr:unnamed protein product [Paramecium octaurelia]
MHNSAFLFSVLEDKLHKLYQGNVHVLESIQYFQLKNIRTIIVVGQHNYKQYTDFVTYHKVDDNHTDIIKTFERIALLISNEIKRSSVLVCCSNGLNWSAAITIAYLIKVKQWQYEKAFYHLKSLKSLVNPSLPLKKQLILFNTKIHNHKQQNQENNINYCNLITPSKFQQRIIEQTQKQQYLEDSIHSQDDIQSTGSCQGGQTPIFYSPNKQSLIQKRKQSTNPKSPEKRTSRHIRNYTFQIDDSTAQQLQNIEQQVQSSPQFKNEEEQLILRHRRRRITHRTKSALNQK